jgi:hypothetical protein
MFAANIWHWWIGVALLAVAVLTVIALLGQYLKQVTATRYPGGRRRRESDL